MKGLLLVMVVVLMLGGMTAACAEVPAVQIMSAGLVYVAPVNTGTPFVGGLLTLQLPADWGGWTRYIYPAAVVRTGGLASTSSLCPALALPVKINDAPVAFIGVTYAGAGLRTAVFAGVDLIALLGLK